MHYGFKKKERDFYEDGYTILKSDCFNNIGRMRISGSSVILSKWKDLKKDTPEMPKNIEGKTLA